MRRTDVRTQLLEAGVAALHSKGFNGCGVQEITEAAGVPKGSFYNYFESKEAFSAEVIAYYWDHVACNNLEVLSDETIPAAERLKHYFTQRALAHASLNFERGCMIGNLATEISGQSRLVRDRLAGLFANWTRVIKNCIQEAQTDGDIDSEIDAGTLASFLVNAWQGAVARAKVERDASSFEDFKRVVFSKLFVGAAPVKAE